MRLRPSALQFTCIVLDVTIHMTRHTGARNYDPVTKPTSASSLGAQASPESTSAPATNGAIEMGTTPATTLALDREAGDTAAPRIHDDDSLAENPRDPVDGGFTMERHRGDLERIRRCGPQKRRPQFIAQGAPRPS
ncbi:hypothetical protein BOTBODRAFT_46834 [Botryobasidium botryosum FD-172 SS1]|uniref:Uncharacterized protein n=1 Tax=Botryobasidium botryosum (strain FD-172 SS1) TaxID=930990 RepID=A0A067MG39_BOTB1|nr:hypothetical protein BOTBODRAFT_46834 [Botryobasidium botryosum FD-172 SS1]